MDFSSWDKFEGLLYNISKEAGYKPVKGERPKRKPSPLISPAVYKPDTTRANDNVVAWAGWAAVDVDDHDFKGNLVATPHIGGMTKDAQYLAYHAAANDLIKII